MAAVIYALWLAVSLFFIPTRTFALTVEEVMSEVIRNIAGPPGKAVVASGKMKTSTKNSDILLLRYVEADKLIEVVQTDLFRSGEAGGDANWKYKIFWDKNGHIYEDENGIHQLLYLPSLRRQRIPSTDLLDGVYDGQYPYGLLPLFGILEDFSYTSLRQEGEQFLVSAVRKPESSSPFPSAEFTIGVRGATLVIEKASYTTDRKGDTVLQMLEDYREVSDAEGYFAPYKVSAADTIFTFTRWSAIDPPSWVLSRLNIGMHNIPKPQRTLK